ncbi:hypothetical protein O181_009182 [Austropuccinia psidii MF-1]|uniref:Uncharacterized protein n=1 Tax=Austropuccinia psidii MF-1 TaxID=1389203 RepID=A0A9Q3GK30_9BASI|nr:hypothetical protein [Austropuccinia psidii MF-1]
MEDVITRTRIGKKCTRNPMESKIVPRTCKEGRRPERPVSKCHRCGRTSNSANTFTKNDKINEVQVIEEVQYDEEKEESDQDSEISEDKPAEDYPIETLQLSLKLLKSILTLHNIVKTATTLSISKKPECVRLNLLEAKVTLMEHLLSNQSL